MAEAASFDLILFVSGTTPVMEEARASAKAALTRLDEREATLEVIDVWDDPGRAERDHVMVTPTLMRADDPRIRLVGGHFDDDAFAHLLGARTVRY